MYMKGPNYKLGFMLTPDEHWTDYERLGLKCIDKEIFRLEWDSSGYGIMHRRLQKMVEDWMKNREVAKIMFEEGDMKKAVTKMTTNDDGTLMSYSDIRSRFG